MKYVYIDESGDLGSKKSSSNYFVLAGIMVDKPKKLDNLIKNTYRKYKKIHKMNEIKGTTAPEDVKKDIFKRLKILITRISLLYLINRICIKLIINIILTCYMIF